MFLTLVSSQAPSPPECGSPPPSPAGNRGRDPGGRRIWFPVREQHSVGESLLQLWGRRDPRPPLTSDTGGLL